jgi:hypothetical protein
MAFVRVLLIHEYNCEKCLEAYDVTPNAELGILIFSHPGEHVTGRTCENNGQSFTKKTSDFSERLEVASIHIPPVKD